MIIPIVCLNPDCAESGREVNRVSGILPPQLDLFYESYNGSETEDHCPVCHELGIAEDPVLEFSWEAKYYEGSLRN